VSEPSPIPNGEQIEVLLSTYNGAKYLDAFVKSLVDQDFVDWILTVRDDGSSDDTRARLELWRQRFPAKVRLIDEAEPRNLGFLRSFSRLLDLSRARYVMFADQDDIWLPGKMRLTLDAMRKREEQIGSDRPIVVHTDAIVVDQELHPIGRTAWANQGRSPEQRSIFPRVMVENVVLGCTAMLNRPLIDITATIPPEAIYHDWWVAMVASALGEMVAVAEPTLLWRRHTTNGSEMSDALKVLRKALTDPPIVRQRLSSLLDQVRPRAEAFLDRYREQMQPSHVAAAEALVRLPQRDFVSRRTDILRHQLLFTSRLRNCTMLALV
jgi:hypothetical protein